MSEDPVADDMPDKRRSRLAFFLRPAFLVPLTLLVVAVASLLSYRASRLADIPPIDEIVDRETDGRVDITPEENAFTYYERAGGLLPSTLDDNALGVALKENGVPVWATVSPAARHSLELSQTALMEWKRGTACTQGVRIQPADLDWMNYIGVQDSQTWVRLAILQTSRCLDEGRSEEAWQWLNALFRFSRHCSNPGPMIDRLVGTSIHYRASRAAIDWAVHESATTDLIEAALTDLRGMFRLTVQNSVILKSDYLATTRMLSTPEGVHTFLRSIDTGLGVRKLGIPKELRGIYLFINAEPELAELILRHALANHLSQCDKPRRQRDVSAARSSLFQPTGKETPPLMDPAVLDECLQRSVLTAFLGMSIQLPEYTDREAARQTALELSLIVELFRRKHDRYPATLDELVPEWLDEVPGDLFSHDPAGRMLIVRREAVEHDSESEEEEPTDTEPVLIIYSRGVNGLDDGGDLDHVNDVGLRIPLNR